VHLLPQLLVCLGDEARADSDLGVGVLDWLALFGDGGEFLLVLLTRSRRLLGGLLCLAERIVQVL
jgi:hypothetical protein